MAQRILALGTYNKLLTIKKTVWFGLVTRRLLLKKVTQNSPKSCPAESAECSFFLEPGFEEFCPFLCSLVVQKLSCPLKSSDNSKPFATFFCTVWFLDAPRPLSMDELVPLRLNPIKGKETRKVTSLCSSTPLVLPRLYAL